jgi:hypothetical protein
MRSGSRRHLERGFGNWTRTHPHIQRRVCRNPTMAAFASPELSPSESFCIIYIYIYIYVCNTVPCVSQSLGRPSVFVFVCIVS